MMILNIAFALFGAFMAGSLAFWGGRLSQKAFRSNMLMFKNGEQHGPSQTDRSSAKKNYSYYAALDALKLPGCLTVFATAIWGIVGGATGWMLASNIGGQQ
jgi:membrane protein DedA with SNARE-associated domain